jgi:hypothetical protein
MSCVPLDVKISHKRDLIWELFGQIDLKNSQFQSLATLFSGNLNIFSIFKIKHNDQLLRQKTCVCVGGGG